MELSFMDYAAKAYTYFVTWSNCRFNTVMSMITKDSVNAVITKGLYSFFEVILVSLSHRHKRGSTSAWQLRGVVLLYCCQLRHMFVLGVSITS